MVTRYGPEEGISEGDKLRCSKQGRVLELDPNRLSDLGPRMGSSSGSGSSVVCLMSG